MLRIVNYFACALVLSLFARIPANAQDLKSAIKLSESEQFDVAHKAFDDLLTKDPTNGEAYYYYGESWLKQYLVDSNAVSKTEACKSALKYFTLGTEKVPGEPLNFIGAGRVDILLGKFEDAETNFQKAKALMPLQGMKYNKSAIPVAKQALAYAKIAEAYLHKPGKTKEDLLAIIENAVERDATVAEVYIIKGDIYKTFSYNDLSPAIAAYNQANTLDPQSCKAMVKIGQVWVRGAALDEALDYYKKAIEIDSTFAPAYRERGDLYGYIKKWEDGIKDYNKFLELSGNNFYAKVRYASFLYMAEKYDDAIKVMEELKKTDDNAISTIYNYVNRLLAKSYFQVGRTQEAQATIELFFKNAVPEKILTDDYISYGDILAKIGNHDLAVEKYMKVIELDPQNGEIYTKAAKEYNTLKKLEDAAKVYEKKIAVVSPNKTVLTDYYELGKVYLNLKQYDKADTSFGTVLAKKPDFINAVMYMASSKAAQDSTSEKGLAKPYYERLAELSLADSSKYVKYLTTSYEYLRYYYFKQYNMNKKCEDAKKSIVYCDKILAIDPKNENSLTIKKSFVGLCP